MGEGIAMGSSNVVDSMECRTKRSFHRSAGALCMIGYCTPTTDAGHPAGISNACSEAAALASVEARAGGAFAMSAIIGHQALDGFVVSP